VPFSPVMSRVDYRYVGSHSGFTELVVSIHLLCLARASAYGGFSQSWSTEMDVYFESRCPDGDQLRVLAVRRTHAATHRIVTPYLASRYS